MVETDAVLALALCLSLLIVPMPTTAAGTQETLSPHIPLGAHEKPTGEPAGNSSGGGFSGVAVNKSGVDLRNSQPTAVGSDSASHDPIRVVFTINGSVDARHSHLRALGATLEAQHNTRVQATIALDRLETYRAKPWIEHVRRPRTATPTVVSEGVSAINASAVHQQGGTGQNVSVGVLAVTGFDSSNSEISSNIQGTRSFTSAGLANGGTHRHGTAVAEIVVDTAPDADLYLANFGTGVEYQNAVSWMEAQNVDVIVMSASFFEEPFDGTGTISETADTAVTNGSVWVNSAGNYRERHWQGQFTDGDGDDWLNYTSQSESNWLNEGTQMQAGETVKVSLTWDEWPATDQDYDLYLVDSESNIVHRSDRTQDGDDEPTETIQTQVPSDGTYGIAVKQHNASGADTLELFSFSGSGDEFVHHVPNSSVTAPAAGDETISVGAFNHADRQLQPYSSEGPTNDGDVGVNVAGPDAVTTSAYAGSFPGTSAAAPHVAGTAALLIEHHHSLSPQAVEERLEQTASDGPTPGFDTRDGYGYVDAAAAVQSQVTTTRGGGTWYPADQTGTIGSNATIYWGENLTDNNLNGTGHPPSSLSQLTNTGHSSDQLANPVPEVTDQYAVDPDSPGSSYDLFVQEPRILSVEVRNNTGRDVAAGTLLETQNDTYVYVRYNYEKAENIQLSLVDNGGNGSDVTDKALDASGNNTNPVNPHSFSRSAIDRVGQDAVRFDLAPGELGVGDYQLTVEPNGDIAGDAADAMTTISIATAGNSSTLFTSALPGSSGQGPPTDIDDDGQYEDVNGDGQGTFQDAVALAFVQTTGLSQAQKDALDFDGDGDVDFDDAIALAFDPALV